MTIVLQPVPNPLVDGEPAFEYPRITADDYRERIERLRALAAERYSHLVVYADREHFSNLEYLCGFDPRFEEALFVLPVAGGEPSIIVGYEGMGYAAGLAIPARKLLYTPFGLVGQTPGRERFADVLARAGLTRGAAVGLAGWKYFTADDFCDPEHSFEVPWYIVENIRAIAGPDRVENAGALFMDCETGLRHNLDAKELVLHEIAGTRSSRAVGRVLAALRPGLDELAASAAFHLDGYPLAAFPNVNFGYDRVALGIASPLPWRRLEEGMAASVGVGYRRSMCHRTALYAAPGDPGTDAALEGFFRPYYESVVAWYEALGLGAAGGAVYAAAQRPLGSYADFGMVLNPGHLSHSDEWSNSLFAPDCRATLHVGLAVQCDYTALDATAGLGAHVEDGLVLADAPLQDAIAAIAPRSLERMLARREFMRSVLGIRVRDEVLPVSDMPGLLAPFMKEPGLALVRE